MRYRLIKNNDRYSVQQIDDFGYLPDWVTLKTFVNLELAISLYKHFINSRNSDTDIEIIFTE